MENPLVSVIIPVYNVEKYLEECVNSVINQTYKNIEVILVDDGSTDSSGDICDEYVMFDSRISVLHKANGGLSSARNAGTRKASGEYIYYPDSDDYTDIHAIERLVCHAQETGADIVFFSASSFGDDGGAVAQNYVYSKDYGTLSGAEMFGELMKNKEFHSSVPLLFIRRDFIDKNKLSFADGIFHEDMIFTFEAFMLASVVSHFNSQLYFRRYRAGSIMTSVKNEKYFHDMIYVYNEVCSFAANFADSDGVSEYAARCAFNALNTYSRLNSHDRNQNREAYNQLKKQILSQNAHGVASLGARCRSQAAWAVYKIFEKLFGR